MFNVYKSKKYLNKNDLNNTFIFLNKFYLFYFINKMLGKIKLTSFGEIRCKIVKIRLYNTEIMLLTWWRVYAFLL